MFSINYFILPCIIAQSLALLVTWFSSSSFRGNARQGWSLASIIGQVIWKAIFGNEITLMIRYTIKTKL